ncbi:MAG: transposase [Nitrospira sp.]|nr:transposase [Nitrospira sp.]
MKRSKFLEEQVVHVLRQAESGTPVGDLCPQYGMIESFSGRLRDEYLNGHPFASLAEAQIIIEARRVGYNTRRPYSSLGHLTLSEFVSLCQDERTTEEVVCSD